MHRAVIVALLLLLPLPAAAERMCDQWRSATTTGTISTVERVPAVAGKRIYLCGYMIARTGTGQELEFEIVAGTGQNCGANTSSLVGPMTLPPNTVIVNRTPYATGEKAPLGHAVCLRTFGSGSLVSVFYWTQF